MTSTCASGCEESGDLGQMRLARRSIHKRASQLTDVWAWEANFAMTNAEEMD